MQKESKRRETSALDDCLRKVGMRICYKEGILEGR